MRRSILLLSACLLASTAGAQVATPRLKAAPVAQPSPGGRPGAEAIGPKQDDPARPGAAAVARPGDDEDPKARCVPTGR